jgi:glycosyltransferase involved in cell wall biosynthesis
MTAPTIHHDVVKTHAQTPASQGPKPLVSIVVPAFNEATILENNLNAVCEYMDSLMDEYRWELIIINDGSTDDTGEIAERFAKTKSNTRVLHHIKNFGLGQAFRFAFRHCHGDYIVTFDADLSYSPEHIRQLLVRLQQTRAKVVLASPYMKGGTITNVPWLRRVLSTWANRFLSLVAHGHLSTITCMVRAYDGLFIRSMSLRSMSMDIMPEVLYKTMVLRGRIEQVPAHLDWSLQVARKGGRQSSMRILTHVLSTLVSGFVFRPFMFFIFPGLLLFMFAAWVNTWMFIHFFEKYFSLPDNLTTGRLTAAMSAAYAQYPYTFIVGLLALTLAVQLISLGILALQNKKYFEEMFYLGSTLYREQTRNSEDV